MCATRRLINVFCNINGLGGGTRSTEFQSRNCHLTRTRRSGRGSLVAGLSPIANGANWVHVPMSPIISHCRDVRKHIRL